MELIRKHDINFYYQNAPIKILPIDWPKSISFLSKFGTYYRGAYVTLEKYPDNSWVEVSRFAIRYIIKVGVKIIVILMVTVDQYILFRMILLGLDTDVGFIKLKVKNKVNLFD